MKMKLKKSIGFKMAIAMAVGLFVVISFFSHTNVRLSEKRLLSHAEREASKISDAIKSSLDNAMCNNESAGVQLIIDAIGQESMVNDIKVIDIDGLVSHAKNRYDIGKILEKTEKSCALCHDESDSISHSNLSVIFTLEDDSKTLRNVNPILNEPRCHGCHEPEEKVLGKLLVDFTTSDIYQMVADNRKLLILTAVATLLASIFMCFLLATVLVKKPLHQLLLKMTLDDEEEDPDTVIEGEDEVAILDETYDGMMASIMVRDEKIKRQLRKINKQMDELKALFNISEILNKSTSIDENVDLVMKALNIGFKVEQCAILLLDGASFKLAGCHGMEDSQTKTLAECLSEMEQLDKIKEGDAFVLPGCGAIQTDFLVVPLKSANEIIGVLTVHTVAGVNITDDKLQKSFSIIATSLAPHFQIGLSQSEKQEMQVSPFNSFLISVEHEIDKVKEYSGSLSLVMVQVQNYEELCQSKGVEAASESVKDVAVKLSENLSDVHECTRIAEDMIAVILPMLDAFDAPDTINPAVSMTDTEATLSTKIVTYPDNGTTAIELLHALRG
ncbi:MAG: hypothetical protein KAK02_09555 [Desulfobulbaceae bacterium]|nr:hypothetical protein [Desulfobulbaceae bacterium]